MLRIISCLDIKNNFVVKGSKFKKLIRINSPIILCNKYNKLEVDEIILLDITSNYLKKSLNYSTIKKISKKINIPLSIGGGIKTIDKIYKLLKIGADKICINSFSYDKINIIKKISNIFGSQSLIIAIDIKNKKCFKNSGFINTNFNYFDWIIIIKKIGCGEILITSIDYDGLKNGYDIESIFYIKKNINISLIISGGMGSINDIYYLYKFCKIKNFLIASLFHFNYIKPYFIKYFNLLI